VDDGRNPRISLKPFVIFVSFVFQIAESRFDNQRSGSGTQQAMPGAPMDQSVSALSSDNAP
jgi:hypothetical protein